MSTRTVKEIVHYGFVIEKMMLIDTLYLCFLHLSRVMRKLAFWFPTCFDTNQAVQLQKMARGFKFQI